MYLSLHWIPVLLPLSSENLRIVIFCCGSYDGDWSRYYYLSFILFSVWQETVDAITEFEEKMKMILPPSKDDDG